MQRRRFIISWTALGLIVPLGFSLLAFGQAKNAKARPEKARDPVCGIMVEKDPKLSSQYKGKIYYFCSKADRDKFNKTPEKYVTDK